MQILDSNIEAVLVKLFLQRVQCRCGGRHLYSVDSVLQITNVRSLLIIVSVVNCGGGFRHIILCKIIMDVMTNVYFNLLVMLIRS